MEQTWHTRRMNWLTGTVLVNERRVSEHNQKLVTDVDDRECTCTCSLINDNKYNKHPCSIIHWLVPTKMSAVSLVLYLLLFCKRKMASPKHKLSVQESPW